MKDSSHLKGKRQKPHHKEDDQNHEDREVDENAPLVATTAEESEKLLAKMVDISQKISDVCFLLKNNYVFRELSLS